MTGAVGKHDHKGLKRLPRQALRQFSNDYRGRMGIWHGGRVVSGGGGGKWSQLYWIPELGYGGKAGSLICVPCRSRFYTKPQRAQRSVTATKIPKPQTALQELAEIEEDQKKKVIHAYR